MTGIHEVSDVVDHPQLAGVSPAAEPGPVWETPRKLSAHRLNPATCAHQNVSSSSKSNLPAATTHDDNRHGSSRSRSSHQYGGVRFDAGAKSRRKGKDNSCNRSKEASH